MRVLVIDDDDVIRVMVCRMLTDAGYETVDAADGDKGLHLMTTEPDISLVITDLIMPEKEGVETIRELRDKYPHVKILAISGGGKGGADTYLKIAERIGADASLKKPFVTEDLLTLVRELVSGER